MRKEWLAAFNKSLDEDHNSTESVLMRPIELSDASPYAHHKCAARVDCVSYMTALDLFGLMAGGPPFVAVYEDGLIRRFE